MKLLKRAILLLLACALLTGLALADIVWEPIDDYYWAHTDDFSYNGYSYFVNGKDGYAILYDKPAGKAIKGFENGETFWIAWTVEKSGKTWGVVETDKANGYFQMDEMLRVYDSARFQEEHADELAASLNEVPTLPEQVLAWSFPHSGVIDFTLDFSDGNMDKPTFQCFYTDDEGLLWGYCGYHYGYRDFWVCLSDPMNEALSVTQIDYPDQIAPQPVPAKLPGGGTDATIWIAVALVAGVVLVTAILLLRFKKPKNNT